MSTSKDTVQTAAGDGVGTELIDWVAKDTWRDKGEPKAASSDGSTRTDSITGLVGDDQELHTPPIQSLESDTCYRGS